MKHEATLYDKFVRTAARVIGLLAPATARNYLKNHLQLRGYDAAVTFGSVNQEWRPGLFSGDKELGKGYQVATERARDLDRNHPLVKEALKVSFAFSVGTALDPQFNILTDDKKRDDKAIDLIENAFWRWAEDCTIDGRDWQDIKELVFRHLKIDGEVFVIETADEHHPFKLQLVESTQLSSVEGNMKNGNFAVRGIEFNKFGRPVFYHFYKAQPGSFSLSGETVAVPARIVHHIYKPGRITETRGISHYVSAVMSLYDQNELSDQILELHRVAAAFGIIVESEDVDAVAGFGEQATASTEKKVTRFGPVRVNHLRPGEKTSAVKPELPTGAFSEFDRSYLRKCAKGFSQSYETFTGDFSNANFSTLKAGQNSERAIFRLDSDFMIRKFCRPIVQRWLDIEVIRGLKLSGYWQNKEYYQRMRFTLPALPATDPVKDENADKLALENGTTNRRLICERKGVDYEENLEELKEEQVHFANLLVPAKTVTATATADADEEENEKGDIE